MKKASEGEKVLMRYAGCSLEDLRQNGVCVCVGTKLANAINNLASRSAWTGYGLAHNGVFPAGMEVMYGKRRGKKNHP